MRGWLVVLFMIGWAATGVGAASALDQDGFFGEDEIRQLVSGITFEGDFTDGVKWREAYHTDGSLAYESRGSSWIGDWHADGELFCTFYRGVIDGGCYLVRQVSNNCFYFYVAGVGLDQPSMTRSVEDRKTWYARGWRTNAASTCPDQAVS
ncbi:MAG: hypothetical protein R3D57_00185 [Hyphomicrobiaceae bacterium]